jgi:hypothetical protein
MSDRKADIAKALAHLVIARRYMAEARALAALAEAEHRKAVALVGESEEPTKEGTGK